MSEAVTIPARPAGSQYATPLPTPVKSLRYGPMEAFKTPDQAYAAAGENMAILGARGSIFPTKGIVVTKKNITFGAFGNETLPRPKLIGKGSTGTYGAVIDHNKGDGLQVSDIDFGDDDDTKYRGIVLAGKNATVSNCGFAPQLFEAIWATNLAYRYRVYYCAAPAGISGNFFYSSLGSQWGEVEHCYCTNSVNEHCLRMHTTHMRITQNVFAMKDRIDPATGKKSYKACINLRQGFDVLAYDNKCSGGQVFVVGPLASETTGKLDKVDIGYNQCDDAVQFQLFHGATNINIHHNTVIKRGGTGTVFDISKSTITRPAPTGTVTDNKYRGTKLFNGDASKLNPARNIVV